MKTKMLLLIVALCVCGSLGTSPLVADRATDQRTASELSSRSSTWVVSRVMDATVKDLQGDKLGTIKDVVLDPATGRAKFAVIKLSGEVGPRDAYAPVPWALLKSSKTATGEEPKTFILNVDKDKFASAQKFYLNEWPDYNEATWGPQVYSYYGLDYGAPGVERGGTGTAVEMGTENDHYYRHDMGRYGPTRSDGTPIDNGTAPDGKGTFVKGPRF